jgi:hypothetical protein
VLQILPANRNFDFIENELKMGQQIDKYEDVLRVELSNDDQLVDEEINQMLEVKISQESLAIEKVK